MLNVNLSLHIKLHEARHELQQNLTNCYVQHGIILLMLMYSDKSESRDVTFGYL